MHVNPLVSDGNYSIGYDASGNAGQWDGNMTETCEEFRPAKEDDEFSDGSEIWTVIADGDGELIWSDPNGDWTPVAAVLRAYGDR